jgi:hypothetical protein
MDHGKDCKNKRRIPHSQKIRVSGDLHNDIRKSAAAGKKWLKCQEDCEFSHPTKEEVTEYLLRNRKSDACLITFNPAILSPAYDSWGSNNSIFKDPHTPSQPEVNPQGPSTEPQVVNPQTKQGSEMEIDDQTLRDSRHAPKLAPFVKATASPLPRTNPMTGTGGPALPSFGSFGLSPMSGDSTQVPGGPSPQSDTQYTKSLAMNLVGSLENVKRTSEAKLDRVLELLEDIIQWQNLASDAINRLNRQSEIS